MNIIFWLEYPLFHVAPLIKSLSFHEGINITVVTEFEIPQWRLDMGFYKPDFGLAKEYFCPGPQERKILINDFSSNNDYHVFHGLRHVKENFKCFKSLAKSNSSVGLYFEYLYSDKAIKRILRSAYYRFLFFRYQKDIDFMLALGDSGREHYISLGLPEEKVFPFNYFINDSDVANKQVQDNSLSKELPLRLLFVGQFNTTKNVAMLLSSFQKLIHTYPNLALTLVGDGELKETLYQVVDVCYLNDKVNFLTYVPNNELKKIYGEHDILILPSKWDGWGAVVVEAMSQGLPVVVSDRCGASSIVTEEGHGVIFDSRSEEALTEALLKIIKNKEAYLSSSNRSKILKYTTENLTASSGAKKLLDTLDQVRSIK